MAKSKIKAYSPNVLDYPSNMSIWEKESLAAEAQLASERKSKKKPSRMIVKQVLRERRKRRSLKVLHSA